MEDTLKAALGVTLTLTVIATGIFLARALLSKNPSTFDRTESSAFGRTLCTVRVSLVLVGWFSVVVLGVNSVLALYLGRWGEAPWTLASLLAFSTLPVLIALTNLPRLRHDLAVLTQAGVWERKQLQSLTPPSPEELERLLAESQDPTKSALERQVAATKHGFGSALRARDAQLEAALLSRLEREARAREERERDTAAKAAVEAAARQAEQERVQRIDQMLEARFESLPTLDSRQMIPDEIPPSVVLTIQLTKELWGEFRRHVAEPVPTTAEAAVEAARAFKARVADMEGVLIAAGCEPAAVYSGNPRDGYCDLMMRHTNGSASAAYRGLLFAETVPGLTSALFFAAALPRHWSWGHGLYDRDAELIISLDSLKALLGHESRGATPGGDELWPPPGVRLHRIGNDGYEIACLAYRPGRGLMDISVRVRDGQAEAMQQRDVFIWGQGIFC
jgi:hypothetical protein